MMIQTLIDQKQADFERESDRDAHVIRYGILRQGRLLPATQGVPEAVVLRLYKSNKDSQPRLYFYDAAGEKYSKVEQNGKEEFVFFQDLTGVILLVDPFVLPKVCQELRERDEWFWKAIGAMKPPLTPLEDVVASLCRNVRKFLKYGRSGRTHVPLAVVINKADVPEVNHRVGAAMTTNAGGKQSEHSICRQALVDCGAGNEVSALEHEFASIRYFSCSTLGRVPDGSGRPFVAEKVLPPLQYLLQL
jgi:hypothetical protein